MSNHFRGPAAATSKATPHTLCQKCLKRGHYSYECKAPAQERPYTSRPSRTQQLANPKLIPTLTSDIPNDLLRKRGIADEELAKKDEERRRKRKAEEVSHINGSRKRSRSRSLSSTSVSTISTNLSRSPALSPKRAARVHTGQSQSLADLRVDCKRRRSSGISMSFSSESSHGEKRNDRSLIRGHKASRWKSSVSPVVVGRRRSPDQPGDRGRRREEYSRSRSTSYTSGSSFERRCRRDSYREDRSKRRRRSFRSPNDRGRDRESFGTRGSRRTRSPSDSRDRSQLNKNRKSMTPGFPSRQIDGPRRREHRPSLTASDDYSKDNDRYGGSARDRIENVRPTRLPPNESPFKRERSLSPFSKRLALTQAMNMGR